VFKNVVLVPLWVFSLKKVRGGSFGGTFKGIELKKYDREIFDNQQIFNFVPFTISSLSQIRIMKVLVKNVYLLVVKISSHAYNMGS